MDVAFSYFLVGLVAGAFVLFLVNRRKDKKRPPSSGEGSSGGGGRSEPVDTNIP